MSLLIFQVENTGRCSAHGPGQTHIQTTPNLTKENQLGFIKGIFLQAIVPKLFTVQAGEEVGVLPTLGTACKLISAQQCLYSSQMSKRDEGQ